MRNKFFLSAIVIVACVAAFACIKPVKVVGIFPKDKETKVDIDHSFGTFNYQTVLCEPNGINFSVLIVKISGNDNPNTYEKHFKNRLPAKENLRIERSVANYIFYTESLACYLNSFTKLRRLNI